MSFLIMVDTFNHILYVIFPWYIFAEIKLNFTFFFGGGGGGGRILRKRNGIL